MHFLKKVINYFWLHLWVYRVTEIRQRKYIAKLSNRRKKNVVFMALDVAMWKYQGIYELMAADRRFRPYIVISPSPLRESPEKDAERLRQYFQQHHTPYIDYKSGEKPFDIRGKLDPDIIFYTQPYEYLLCPEHDCKAFYDRLVCYIPYGFNTFKGWAYNLHFCNLAWRLYYPTQENLEIARHKMFNKGRNIRMVGNANADRFLLPPKSQPWRTINDQKKRKRVIWAPHFTIDNTHNTIPRRSNFLWMADLMLHIAHEYGDQLQIAFKPHPALLTQLYDHKDWGRERADAYYHKWETMENTQLETGEYIDLFMTSDAMIHDCATFTAEYHYSHNPTMFVTKDIDSIKKELSPLGIRALNLHYIGSSETDIRRFINEVVIEGNDPMSPQRELFYRDSLLPPRGKQVAQNVYDDIIESLGLE